VVLSLPPGLLETGGVAQLGERLLCKQEVIGSIPFTSTIRWKRCGRFAALCATTRQEDVIRDPGSLTQDRECVD
jgi:hypothetical protein